MGAKIRLTRVGTKGKPFYRVIVIDESAARNARAIEVLGHYDPKREPSVFEVNKERTESWIKKGAVPSDTVRKMLGKAGILPQVDYSKKTKRKSKGAQEEAKAEPQAEEKK